MRQLFWNIPKAIKCFIDPAPDQNSYMMRGAPQTGREVSAPAGNCFVKERGETTTYTLTALIKENGVLRVEKYTKVLTAQNSFETTGSIQGTGFMDIRPVVNAVTFTVIMPEGQLFPFRCGYRYEQWKYDEGTDEWNLKVGEESVKVDPEQVGTHTLTLTTPEDLPINADNGYNITLSYQVPPGCSVTYSCQLAPQSFTDEKMPYLEEAPADWIGSVFDTSEWITWLSTNHYDATSVTISDPDGVLEVRFGGQFYNRGMNLGSGDLRFALEVFPASDRKETPINAPKIFGHSKTVQIRPVPGTWGVTAGNGGRYGGLVSLGLKNGSVVEVNFDTGVVPLKFGTVTVLEKRISTSEYSEGIILRLRVQLLSMADQIAVQIVAGDRYEDDEGSYKGRVVDSAKAAGNRFVDVECYLLDDSETIYLDWRNDNYESWSIEPGASGTHIVNRNSLINFDTAPVVSSPPEWLINA